MRTHYHTVYLEDDTEISLEYTRSPYDPGVSSGPAESCYPPEGGEVEITGAEAKVDGEWEPYTPSIEQFDKWEQEISELPIEIDEPDWDYLYDRMRDERDFG